MFSAIIRLILLGSRDYAGAECPQAEVPNGPRDVKESCMTHMRRGLDPPRMTRLSPCMCEPCHLPMM